MNLKVLDFFKSKKQHKHEVNDSSEDYYEYCPRCEANLTLQKGYSNELPYWICKGCGEMLINPEIPGDIIWRCDKCEALLNIQKDFSEECDRWVCTECGYSNSIGEENLFLSEDERRAELKNPYRGLSDEASLKLLMYDDVESINERGNVSIVISAEDNKRYVKKILSIYDESIYLYLKDNPVHGIPNIREVFKSSNSLIVIEDYIEGNTLASILKNGPLEEEKAVYIAKQICLVIKELHNREKPIIHRDIKPLNVIIDSLGEVFLLDLNVAKWFKPEENEDTTFLGTMYYAAPEQQGYGFSSSTVKTDIYALGMLLNVMLTGKFPKEERATGPVWNIIEKCINLEEEKRFSDEELIEALDKLQEKEC